METRIRRPFKSVIFITISLLILASVFYWAADENRQSGLIFWDGIALGIKAPDGLIKEDQAKNISYARFVSNLNDAKKMRNQTFDYQNSLFREFTVGAVLEADSDPDKFDPKAHVVQYYLYPEDAVYFGNIPETVMSRMGTGAGGCTGKCVASFNGVTKVKGLYFDFTYIVATGKLTPGDLLQHEKILESAIKSFIKLNQ